MKNKKRNVPHVLSWCFSPDKQKMISRLEEFISYNHSFLNKFRGVVSPLARARILDELGQAFILLSHLKS